MTRELTDEQIIARAAHEVNRAYCKSLGDNSQPSWEDAPQWQWDSAMLGVKLHTENPGASPAASHESWMAQKVADGWIYGQEKRLDLKQHPCIVPFDALPVEQQAKDFIFQAVVHAARAVIAADRELQDARHSEELAAYELTISNLRAAHRVPDGWVLAPNEATTEMVLALMGTGLRNTEYKSKAASPSIFEMKQGYSAMLAAAPQPAAQPERNPPDPADIIAGALGTSRAHAYDLMREACAAAQPESSTTDYLRRIYDYLASTAPSGFADEAFRLPPAATRAQRALHDAATRYQHTQHSGLARQDSDNQRGDCRSVAPQPAAQPAAALTDDEIFLAYTAATGKTLPTLGRSRNDLIAISRAVIAADEAKKGSAA